jgi:VanZ family protein
MADKKINKRKFVFAVLTAAVMVCIFLFSCETADESSDTSGIIVNLILNIFYRNFENMTLAEQTEIMSQISHIIRKTAHFTIYAALGFFSSFTVGQRKLFSKGSLGVVLFCFIYAVSDEIHQYFVPGRSCMFADMLIDTCGGITGMTISFLIMKIFRNGK